LLTVGRDPEDPDVRTLSVTKNNLAPHPRALTFTITSLPDTLTRRDASTFEWGEFVDLTPEETLTVNGNGGGGKSLQTAEEFLREALSEEAIETRKLEVMAEKRSISKVTLHRASIKLGVLKKVEGFGKDKNSRWSLPPSGHRSSQNTTRLRQ